MDIRKFNKKAPVQGTVPTSIPTVIEDSQVSRDVSQAKDVPIAGEQDGEPSGKDVIEAYIKYLEENDITTKDIFKVLDTIIAVGDVFWEFQLLGKIPVIFKMRPAWVNERLVKQVEVDAPKTFARFSDTVSVYNLAGSLVSYNKQSYEIHAEEDLDRNIKFIMSVPFIIQNRLIKQMAIFDRLIAVATSEWAVENFTEPLSEE